MGTPRQINTFIAESHFRGGSRISIGGTPTLWGGGGGRQHTILPIFAKKRHEIENI